MQDAELQPLSLMEDAETGDRFVLYTTPKGINLELRFEADEPWATQKQIAELFGRDVSVISRHLKAIFAEGELAEESNLQKMQIANSDKPIAIHSLDVILAVGYRVSSKQGILFRRWANSILKQYLLKGFVIDSARLKNPKRNDHLDELLEEIEEIRASEANVWKRVLELVAKCSDYHMMKETDRSNFFAAFQNTIHWAVSTSTAAEIIWERSDASKPYAGLTTFDGVDEGRQPKSDDMTVAKNYYGRDELDRLRTITNLASDFLKSQALQGRLVAVAQYTAKLRELVKLDGRPLIRAGHNGDISKPTADVKAKNELAVYKKRLRLEKEARGETEIIDFLEKARAMVAGKRHVKKEKQV